MANELTVINGVTKKEKDGTFYYFFGETVIQAYPAPTFPRDYYRLELENGQEVQEVEFVDITDQLGATDIEGYLDAVATAGLFSTQATVIGGAGDATAANQATQIGLETSIKTNTDFLNVNLSTRATEVTMSAANQNLSSIKDQLDEKTSTRASETTAAGIKTGTDKIPNDPSTVTKQNELIAAIQNNNIPIDAAGDVLVSQGITWLNAVQTRDNLPLIFSREVIGTGTQSFSAPDAHVAFSVSANLDAAIAQTKQRFPYFAGQTQFVEFTLSEFQTEANTTKEAGYFSSSDVSPYTADKDGISIYDDGTTKRIRVYKNGSTLYDIAQTSWNDPLDGTGASGMTVDFEKFNVLGFQFLWLGGTGIEFFIQNGYNRVVFHTINHANTGTGVMIQTPIQPLRFELRSSGGAGSMNQICGTVKTLGGAENVSNRHATSTLATKIDANIVGTKYLIKALRLQDGKEGTVINLLGFAAVASSNDSHIIEVIFNPTIADSGSLTWSNVENSNAESASGEGSNPSTTTVTGGTVLYSTYGVQNTVQSQQIRGNVRIGTDIDGTKDIIALVVTPLTANLDLFGGLNYSEI